MRSMILACVVAVAYIAVPAKSALADWASDELGAWNAYTACLDQKKPFSDAQLLADIEKMKSSGRALLSKINIDVEASKRKINASGNAKVTAADIVSPIYHGLEAGLGPLARNLGYCQDLLDKFLGSAQAKMTEYVNGYIQSSLKDVATQGGTAGRSPIGDQNQKCYIETLVSGSGTCTSDANCHNRVAIRVVSNSTDVHVQCGVWTNGRYKGSEKKCQPAPRECTF